MRIVIDRGPAPEKPAKKRSWLKSRGRRAARLAPWQSQERAAVAERSGGHCEFDNGASRCGRPNPAWHHIAKREGIVSEVFANWRYFCVHLCDQCHHDIHDRPGAWTEICVVIDALWRIYDRWPEAKFIGDETWNPIDRMRAAERWFIANGIDPQETPA